MIPAMVVEVETEKTKIMSNTLKQRAVLMRFSAGLPGEQRQDKNLTAEVKTERNLGERSGKWDKYLYPPDALDAVKSKQNEARTYHNSVTLPFDTGLGILPAILLADYTAKMRQFRGEIEHLVETTFLADPQKWIDWARTEHNGTFNPGNYPGCSEVEGRIEFLPDVFRAAMRKKFYLRAEPIPVPDSTHFESTVATMLGTDADSIDQRVRDASLEAQRELLSRVLEPVKHMAATLAKDKPRIYDSLIENVSAICKLAPALNLADDPALNELVKEVEGLTLYSPTTLRTSDVDREQARKAAEAMVQKLSAYKL